MGGVGPAARDEFAPDSPLQRRVQCEPRFSGAKYESAPNPGPVFASIVIGRKAKARTLEGARPVLPEIEHERPSADLDHAPWRLPIRAASGDDESAPASNGTTIRKKAEPVPLPFRAARLLILAANDDPFKKWAPAGVLSRSDIGLGSQGSVECLQPQT